MTDLTSTLLAAGGALTVVWIVVGFLLLISPIMIWVKASQTVRLLREQNSLLRDILWRSAPTKPPHADNLWDEAQRRSALRRRVGSA